MRDELFADNFLRHARRLDLLHDEWIEPRFDERQVVPSAADAVLAEDQQNGVIVRLSIPADARRSNATGRKCRAEFVQVLEVIGAEVGISKNPSGGPRTKYRAGVTVRADAAAQILAPECAEQCTWRAPRVRPA